MTNLETIISNVEMIKNTIPIDCRVIVVDHEGTILGFACSGAHDTKSGES